MTDRPRPITNPEVIARLKEVVEECIESENFLSLDYLKKRAWTAVPVESALHFDKDDARRIASAAKSIDYRECNAAPAENIIEPGYLRVQLVEKSLYAFSKAVSHFKYLLFPDDVSFAIYCSTDDHYVVAGQRHFVETAIECGIATGRTKFREYANAETNDAVRRFLNRVVSHYEGTSESTK